MTLYMFDKINPPELQCRYCKRIFSKVKGYYTHVTKCCKKDNIKSSLHSKNSNSHKHKSKHTHKKNKQTLNKISPINS